MAPKFGRPSPALVVALIALFVALGGSAIAAGIVPHAKLADRAKVADKATLAAKATVALNSLKLGGQTAAQIVASVPAPPAVSSVSALVVVKTAPFSIAANTLQGVTATCDAGSKVVGGGFSSSPSAPSLSLGSFPTADGSGWTELLLPLVDSGSSTGTVYANCIK
jgi:hypothetical protein